MRKRTSYRKVKMSELKKIYKSYIDGYSLREISSQMSIPKSTVSDYICRISSLGISPEDILRISESDFHNMLFPNEKKEAYNDKLPDFKQIHNELGNKYVTLALLHEEYSANNPEAYCYSHFCKLYEDWKRSKRISMRQAHIPGEKLFIDYAGAKIDIVDKNTGQIKQKPLYVCCLGYSGFIYAEVSESMNSLNFCNSTVNSFCYFGGIPKILVPDNLKAGVISADFYNPRFNMVFEEMADYYDCSIVSARVRKPKDKAKAESSVSVIQRWIVARLRKVIFYSVQEANAAIRKLLEQVNDKIMKHVGKSRRELYDSVEKSALKPLTKERFSPRLTERQKVANDYHIHYNRRYYSVPYKYINEYVTLIVSDRFLCIYHNNNLIANHLLLASAMGKSTIKEHMPIAHQCMDEFDSITYDAIIARAEKIGFHTLELIKHLIDKIGNRVYCKRQCLGIIKVAEAAEPEVADKASEYLMEIPDKRYSVYKHIIKNRSYLQLKKKEIIYSAYCITMHNNIRGKEYYE